MGIQRTSPNLAIPSGNLLQFAIEAMATEKFVDLPMKNCDVPSIWFVDLPIKNGDSPVRELRTGLPEIFHALDSP